MTTGESAFGACARSSTKISAFALAVPVLLALVLSGCIGWENNKSGVVVKRCILPSEQANSLQGKWASAPIKISFKSGDWPSAQEISAIQSAAQSWNAFFQASKGITVFDVGATGIGYQTSTSQTVPNCTAGTISDGVVLYKRWSSWSKSTSYIALTSSCINTTNTSSGSLGTIYNAILEFNYVNYFSTTSTLKAVPDLKSIALHELGHVLGLDHSCGPLNKPNTGKANAACPSYTADSNNYLVQAVMYPSVPFTTADTSGFRYGLVKTSLTENDEGRANCLY